MIRGSNAYLEIRPRVETSLIAEMIFSFFAGDTEKLIMQKRYPEDVTDIDGKLYLEFTQEDTVRLYDGSGDGNVQLETQVNLVGKTVIQMPKRGIKLRHTRAVEIIDGNSPKYDMPDTIIDVVTGDVLIIRGKEGEPGKPGDDGISPTITAIKNDKVATIIITDVNGTKVVTLNDGENGDSGRGVVSIKRTSGTGAAGTIDTYTITYTDNTSNTFNVYNGKDGADGDPGITPHIGTNGNWYIGETDTGVPASGGGGGGGADGVGIASVEQTTTSTEDGGENVVTVRLTNGTSSTFTVLNGSKGSTGDKGDKGADGAPGANGSDGADGVGISEIRTLYETSESGAMNSYGIYLTNGDYKEIYTYNGQKGDKGDKGDPAEGVGAEEYVVTVPQSGWGDTEIGYWYNYPSLPFTYNENTDTLILDVDAEYYNQEARDAFAQVVGMTYPNCLMAKGETGTGAPLVSFNMRILVLRGTAQ